MVKSPKVGVKKPGGVKPNHGKPVATGKSPRMMSGPKTTGGTC